MQNAYLYRRPYKTPATKVQNKLKKDKRITAYF